MCGRFNLRTSVSQIAQIFLPGIDMPAFPAQESRYNIAPTQTILAVVEPGQGTELPGVVKQGRQLALFRWGLIPPWSNELSIGSKMINARSETVAEKPSFKSALKSRRCIIPADGYYEWQATESGKQPYEFSATNGTILALAGLWERNSKASDQLGTLYTCTILTTAANRFMSEIHNRMPVILPQECWDRWLDPEHSDLAEIQSMLVPAPEDLLIKKPVSRKLNNVRNQGPELLVTDDQQ